MQLQIKLWNTDLHSMNLTPLDKLICRVGITKESTPLSAPIAIGGETV